MLNGHDHYYMRSYAIGNYTGEPRRGVYHLVTGGGGAGLYPIVPKIHAAARRQVHHVTVLDVMGDRIVGRAVDRDGEVFDAFVLDNRSVNSPEEFAAYEIYELERDLGRAIREMEVVPAGAEGIGVDTTLVVANPFRAPVRMAFSWVGTNGWEVKPQVEARILQPGVPIRLPIWAKGKADALYPVPTATLQFTTPEGEKAFRNDRVTFYPLKVWSERTLEATVVSEAPNVDGDLSDGGWKQALEIEDFVGVQGSGRPVRRVGARVLQSGETLYVAARMEAPEGITEKGYEGRDNRRAPRNDHFRVHVGVGEEAYTFLVTAHGAMLDTRGGNTTEGREWNSGFRAVTVPTEEGWQAEMAIPLEGMGIDGKPLRINLTRRDVTANTECELSPTFGRSSLDHRVPMYQGDWEAVERFAVLSLE